MAGIIERKNKKGDVTSYRIKVSMGYDINGKQLSKTMTWTPSLDMTKNQITKELNRQAVLFEQKCKQWQCVDENIRFTDLSEMWFTDYAENNFKKTTLVSYKKMLKVVVAQACPNRFDTALSGTPFITRIEAEVCLSECNGI